MTTRFLARFSALILAALVQTALADPLGTAFTYQGELNQSGVPANGEFDFQFQLYDADSLGMTVGSALPLENVSVANGVFTVQLDFGAAPFAGDALWLEVAVRDGTSTAPHTVLAPRQALTAAPYALHSEFVAMGAVGSSEVNPAQVQLRITGVCPAGQAMSAVAENGTVTCEAAGADTLAGLDCGNDQVAKWTGTAWACAADEDSTLSEATVETFVSNGPIDLSAGSSMSGVGLSTGAHTVDTDTTLSEATVESFITNEAIGLADGSSMSGLVLSTGAHTVDTNSGGTVTQVDSGQGLTGGPVTTSGSLALDTSFTDGRYLLLTGGTLSDDFGLEATGVADAGSGFSSGGLSLYSSVFDGSAALGNEFRWQADPVDNNLPAATSRLSLLFGTDLVSVAETGLFIASDGIVTFAPGQSFPGSGDASLGSANVFTAQNTFTAPPTGAGVSQGPVYINPATAGTDDTLLGIAVGGVEHIRVTPKAMNAGSIVANDLFISNSDPGGRAMLVDATDSLALQVNQNGAESGIQSNLNSSVDFNSAIQGSANGTTGRVRGVIGLTASPDGYGLYGINTAFSGLSVASFAQATSPDGMGVVGEGGGTGVVGRGTDSAAWGVRGEVNGASATAGVFANLGNGKILSGRASGETEVFNVAGNGLVTALAFSGDGSSLTGVNADRLDSLDSTAFAAAAHDHFGAVWQGSPAGLFGLRLVNETADTGSDYFGVSGEVISGAGGSSGIRGMAWSNSGFQSGVLGVSFADRGAGVRAGHASTGVDLRLDGLSENETSADLKQSGIDRPSTSAEVFNIQNSRSGTMTLQVDGDDVITSTALAAALLAHRIAEHPKIVFVTSQTYTGNLNGLTGADAICQSLANAKGLVGEFRAWLSADIPASARLSPFDVPYVLVNGTKVADDWFDLTDGTLDQPINRDEGGTLRSGDAVWTHTRDDGSTFGTNPCEPPLGNPWNTDLGIDTALTGLSNAVNSQWTANSTQDCSQLNRLYCLQQ